MSNKSFELNIYFQNKFVTKYIVMGSRNYCATFFANPVRRLNNKEIRYAISGEEICPTTGQKHWQCYIELFKPARIAGVKKILDDEKVHLEPRKGTREQARDYCKKDGKFLELGTWITGQGHRSDLDDVVKKLKEGQTLNSLMVENPKVYCQYRNGLRDIAGSVTKSITQKFREVQVVLLTGPTGCGKTRFAMDEAKYKIQGTQLGWWQDYDQEECICIDEYSNDVKITELLSILDGYQLRLNVKGSHTYANWKKVYITTNLKLEELHREAKQAHKDALMRRITRVIDFWPRQERNEEAPR